MSRYLSALEATEDYVRSLQSMGVRFLHVQEKTLFALRQPLAEQAVTTVLREESEPRVPDVEKPPVVPVVIPPDAVKNTVSPSPSIPPAAAGLGREEKAAMMVAVRERALACVKCPHLVKSRRTVVFGTGDIHARLMFVGEAPGADEDARGEPFVGAAGQLLTRIIKAMGFTRETVYIANILKCRPDMPGQSYGNRRPTPDEMKTCLPWLLEQIDLVRPAVMVALGATAVEGLFGQSRGHHAAARPVPGFSRHSGHADFPSLLSPPQSSEHGEAESVGGHDAGAGKTGPAGHRQAARLLFEGLT